MLIELKFKDETDKAYKLSNNSFIPKSVLEPEGDNYRIVDWWLNTTKKNAKSIGPQSKEAQKVLNALNKLEIQEDE